MDIKGFLKDTKKFICNLNQEYLVDAAKAKEFSADLIAANEPNSYVSEQYRNLAITMMRSKQYAGSKIFLFTSPQARDGKSTTIANIAFVLAGLYKKNVLLIDGDLRRPHLHEIFLKEQGSGLFDLLHNKKFETLEIFTGLDFIRSGVLPGNKADYLSNQEYLSVFLNAQKSKYDFILVDSPPVLKVSDAGVLASCVEQVFLVVRAEATPENLIVQTKNLLDSFGTPATGVVLVNHRQSVDLYSYVTNSYYRNYYSEIYKGYGQQVVAQSPLNAKDV